MKKISTSPFFHKKIFPTIWFGFICLFLILTIAFGAVKQSIMFLIIPIVMAIFGFLFFKKLLWDLADEVLDNGEALIFSLGKKQQTVALRDIININHQFSSPQRVVVTVREAGEIGKEIAFLPPMQINFLAKNKLVEDLIKRVDDARNT